MVQRACWGESAKGGCVHNSTGCGPRTFHYLKHSLARPVGSELWFLAQELLTTALGITPENGRVLQPERPAGQAPHLPRPRRHLLPCRVGAMGGAVSICSPLAGFHWSPLPPG